MSFLRFPIATVGRGAHNNRNEAVRVNLLWNCVPGFEEPDNWPCWLWRMVGWEDGRFGKRGARGGELNARTVGRGGLLLLFADRVKVVREADPATVFELGETHEFSGGIAIAVEGGAG